MLNSETSEGEVEGSRESRDRGEVAGKLVTGGVTST
jgi:hypothetical protein